MALGYDWTTYGTYRMQYGAGDVTFYVGARLIRQDIANNRSLIERSWWYTVANQGYIASDNTQHYLTGNGWTEGAYWNSGTTGGTILQQQAWISHNDDGTGSFSCWGATWMGGLGIETGWVGQDEIALPTIARASVPSVTPNPITLSNDTNRITVNTNRKASAFAHNVTCTIGSFSQTKTGVTTSTTFDIPKSVLASFAANSKTLSGTITCVTKNGNTTIGTKTTNFSAQIDTAQEHPNIGTVTITDTNEYTSAIEAQGSYIRKASDLVVTIPLTVSGSYTELASATVACGNVIQNYVLSGTNQTITFEYDKIDTNGLTITVTDKRGTTAIHTESWNLVPYIDLTVTGSVRRTTETGNEVAFTLTVQCFAGSFGQATNEIEVSYKYKLHSASTWTDGGQTWTFTPSGNGETDYTYTNTITGFAYDQQYDLIFTVKDLFTSASTRDLTLTKGIPVYGNGEDFLAVYGNLFLHNDRDNISQFWDINEAFETILEYHANKNLLTVTATTTTVNGITFTVNDDGTITANGTASADAVFYVGYTKSGLEKGTRTYWFRGCPQGGGSRTYYTGYESASVGTGDAFIFVADDGDGDHLAEFGNWGKYTPYYIVIKGGQTVSNLVFKPMIYDDRIASDEYVQNTPSATELANSISTLSTALNKIGKTSTGSGWTRFKVGDIAFLYRTLSGGTDISFGITFSETPYVLYSVNTGSASTHPNDLLWNVSTTKLSFDSNYGGTTKYTTYMLVFGKYSGNL